VRDLMISSLGHITLVELTPRTYAKIAASPRYAYQPVRIT